MLRKVFLIVLTLLILAGGGAFILLQQWREQQQLEALARPLKAELSVKIPRGTSLAGIAKLVAAGAPVSEREFVTLARRLDVAASLQAGAYRFASGATVESVLRDLAAGNVLVERITFVEGRTTADILAQLAQDKRLKQRLPTMSGDDIRRALNIKHDSLEGLFLPETYFFEPGNTDLSILQRAHRRLNKTLETHWQRREQNGVFKTPYEALILASIVEKETGKADERPLIASVFINRLRASIRLQADPTVIYGLGARFDGNLTRRHLREEGNPYNTYAHAGLTPTPIALAGEAAIAAALRPTDSEYYYFVATGDGGHYFSKTLREHNNAVNRYQRRRR